MAPLILDGSVKYVDMTPEQQVAVLDWVVSTAIAMGATVATAYQVAGEFGVGQERDAGLRHRPPTYRKRR